MSLEDIREQKNSKGIYIVVGLLLVGMAGFGTSGFGGFSNNDPVALTLGEIEVSSSTFTKALNENRRRYPNIDESMIQDATLSQLRQSMALEDYLQKFPLGASKKNIDEVIRNNPAFFDNGKFSEEAFRRYVNVEPQVYRNSISKDIATQLFQNVLGSTVVISNAERMPYIESSTLSRDILVTKITRTDFKNTVNKDEIQAYYDEHKDEYMTEEQVNIEYVDLNPKEIIASIKTDKSEVLKTEKAPRNANYYTFKTAEDAKNSRKNLKNSQANKVDDEGELTDIDAIANAESLIPQKAIDAIFALKKKGQVTDTVEVDGAFYLFELTSEPSDKLSDAQKASAKLKWQKSQAEPKIAALSEKLDKAVFESKSPDLMAIAEETGLSIKKTGLLGLFSGKDLLSVPELVKAIKESEKTTGKLQNPITIGDRVIIYRLTEIKAPEQKALDKVKAMVEKAAITDKTNEELKNTADELIAKAKKDGLEVTAKAAKYPTQAYANFKGQVAADGVLDTIGALLIMRQPPTLGDNNMNQVQSMSGDIYIYTNTTVRLSNKAVEEKNLSQMTGQLMARTAQLELGDFLQSLSSRADIKMQTGILKNNKKVTP